jgi:hypothetical protein
MWYVLPSITCQLYTRMENQHDKCVAVVWVWTTQVKPRKLLQICKQVVTRLLWSRYQDVFALLVPSRCDKFGTSCYHLVTRLMTVTDLLQVVPTRLIQDVRNKLLRACCHQLVNNLLLADDIRLVGTTCCESVGLINLVTKMITTCSRLVNNWETSSANTSWQAVRFLLWSFWQETNQRRCQTRHLSST